MKEALIKNYNHNGWQYFSQRKLIVIVIWDIVQPIINIGEYNKICYYVFV